VLLLLLLLIVVYSANFEVTYPGDYTYRTKGRFEYTVEIQAPSAKPGRVALISDSQSSTATFLGLLHLLAGTRPQKVIMIGDFVQHAGIPQFQHQFFDPLTVGHLGSTIPLALTYGNHDENSWRLRQYLGDDQKFYSFRMAATCFLVLDSRLYSQAQTDWLVDQLQTKECMEAPFRIVLVHIAPFIEFWDPQSWASGEKNWGNYVRESWVPVFEKYEVDLVISGHEHGYQRGVRNDVTYAIIGGGGGELDYERVENWGFYTVTQHAHHYILLEFTFSVLQWEARDTRNNVIDAFTLLSKKGE